MTTPASLPPSGSASRYPAALPRSGSQALRHLGSAVLSALKWPFYRLYEMRLEAAMKHWRLPRHIGVIMDGNRRFARAQGSAQVSYGHARGADKLQQVLSWCYDAGIPVVTVWSFSLDNFQRDTSEVEALLQLFEDRTRELASHSEVHTNEVQVRYIGKTSLLPESLREAIRAVETATAGYDRFHLNIAMAYGGREEISDAFRRYLADQKARGHSLDEVLEAFDERAIEPHLYTVGLPEPDLIVRTSGEVRLSGFLLWQSAYSEFYFCDTHWPAFRRIDFLRALRSHHQRQRRYGR
jgi:short-chain Z-isoprenyl diphosphate synthase